jgi:hypothetical protein
MDKHGRRTQRASLCESVDFPSGRFIRSLRCVNKKRVLLLRGLKLPLPVRAEA